VFSAAARCHRIIKLPAIAVIAGSSFAVVGNPVGSCGQILYVLENRA
jgi:hypothetical protein